MAVLGVVSEGKTDFDAIVAMMHALWPEIEDVLPLQPDRSRTFGGTETPGWTGVKQWCGNHRQWLPAFLGAGCGQAIDLLVIHVDADIAPQVSAVEPEDPPSSDAEPWARRQADRVRAVVREWLAATEHRPLPHQVVLMVPVRQTETWLYAAHRNGSSVVEQHSSPTTLLVQAGLLTAEQVGHPKDAAAYREISSSFGEKLGTLCSTCPEAARFRAEVEAVRDSAGAGG